MDDNKTNSLYEDSDAKEKRFMRFWLIAYIIMLVIVSWIIPGCAFWKSHMKGWDTGDTAMGLFFFLVPIGLVVTILLYTIVTGCIKKARIIYAVCMLPWVFVPFIGSIIFVLLYGGGAAIVGAVGWFINIVVVDPMRDRRFRHKMDALR